MINSKATIWRPDLVYDNIETKEDIEETLKNDLVKIDYAKDSDLKYGDKERKHFLQIFLLFLLILKCDISLESSAQALLISTQK